MHAENANLDGKFVAHTNLGLLYANLGKWTDAAVSHQVFIQLLFILRHDFFHKIQASIPTYTTAIKDLHDHYLSQNFILKDYQILTSKGTSSI